MSRIACTLLLAAGLSVTACGKSPDSAGAPPTPYSDVAAPNAELATQAGLTNALTSQLGISEAQAGAAVGSVLGLAKGKLSPEDYTKLAGAIPGADKFLAMAPDLSGAPVPSQPLAADSAVVPVAPVDSTMAGVDDASADVAAAGAHDAAAAGEAAGTGALSSAFSKIGLPPEAASQFVPVLTDYVGKVGGPEAASILKGLL